MTLGCPVTLGCMIMRRYYRLIISRPTGGVNNYPFNTLISCKASARKIGKPGDRIIIYEIFEDEQNTLYDYIMEDWNG